MTNIQNQRKNAEETKRSNLKTEELQEVRNKLQKQQNEETARANKMREEISKREIDFREKQLKASTAASALGAVGSALGSGAALLMLNDLPWYVKSIAAAESIASLPDEDAIGTMYPIWEEDAFGEHYGVQGVASKTFSMPSTITMDIVPTIGNASAPTDAVNQAADGFWQKINEKNGRNSAYEITDLALYQLGLAGGYQLLGVLQKLYSWISRYVGDDDTKPKSIIEAMGYNYDDIKRHKYDLHALIVDLSNFLNRYDLVPDFFIADRWYFTARTTLADMSDTVQPKMYQYSPLFVLSADVTADATRLVPLYLTGKPVLTTGEQLVARDVTANNTFEKLYQAVETYQQRFFSAQDVKIMNSDIESYYGNETYSLTRVLTLDEEWSIPIAVTTDANALEQFHNARVRKIVANPVVQGVEAFEALGVTQRKATVAGATNATVPYLYSRLYTEENSTRDGHYGVLCFAEDWADVLPENVIEASRLQSTVGDEPYTERTFITSFNTEIPVDLYISMLTQNFNELDQSTSQTLANYDAVPTEFTLRKVRFYDYATSNDSGQTVAETWDTFFDFVYDRSLLSQFRFAPIHVVALNGPADGGQYAPAVFGNFQRIVQLPSKRLFTMNKRIAKRLLGLGDNA